MICPIPYKRVLLLTLCMFTGMLHLAAADLWSKLDLSFPGLERVKVCCDGGDYEGAGVALLEYYRGRQNVVTPEIPDPSRVSFSAREKKMADDALEHRFFVADGYEVYFYGDDINWRYWPIHDNELRWQLHRHKWFSPMGRAYRKSGDERYVREWMQQYLDWIEKNPLVQLDDAEFEITGNMSLSEAQENMRFAWRPLEVSHRVQDQVFQFQLFVDSKDFTPYRRHLVTLAVPEAVLAATWGSYMAFTVMAGST